MSLDLLRCSISGLLRLLLVPVVMATALAGPAELRAEPADAVLLEAAAAPELGAVFNLKGTLKLSGKAKDVNVRFIVVEGLQPMGEVAKSLGSAGKGKSLAVECAFKVTSELSGATVSFAATIARKSGKSTSMTTVSTSTVLTVTRREGIVGLPSELWNRYVELVPQGLKAGYALAGVEAFASVAPAEAVTGYEKGLGHLERIEPEQALAELGKLDGTASPVARMAALNARGVTSAVIGSLPAASVAWEKALAIEDVPARYAAYIHYNWGVLLWKKNQKAQALERFRQAVERHPGFTLAKEALR